MKIHICKICGTECKMSGLGVHLFHKHNLTCKDYYDKFIKKPNEGICEVCGKPTTFRKINQGYNKHCCHACASSASMKKVLKKYNELYNTNETNILNIKEINDKKQQTLLEKYNTDNVSKLSSTKEKYKKTMLEKYGVEHNFQLIHKNNSSLYLYDNIKFDSSYEMIYYIWLKDHNINFIYHPEPIEYKINEKTHYYYPDFIVENEIIELKSTYYLNNLETNEKGLCKLKCMQDNNVKIITDVSEFLKHIKLNYCKNTRKFIRQFRIQKEGSNGLSKNI